MPRRHSWSTALAVMPALLGAASASAQQAQSVSAIWKAQEITFYFQSFTTFYSCNGLEDKLERLIRELGGAVSVSVRSADCSMFVARMPRVVMKVTSPVEATPEALAERDEHKSTRELAARVKGKRAEQELQASLEQFPAQWRRVSLSRGKLGIEQGDCELIQELRHKVLPKLAVRVVRDDLRCSPNQVTLGQPQLEVEALIEMPKPDTAADKASLPGKANEETRVPLTPS